MTTRAEVCEQLKAKLDSLAPGQAVEVQLEEGRAGLDGWGDFWAYCGKEYKKTVKTSFNEEGWSCVILKKADGAPAVAPEPEPEPEPEVEEVSILDVEVEKEPEPEQPKTFFWRTDQSDE